MAAYETLHWRGDATGTLTLIDQTLLPGHYQEIHCPDVETVWDAIRVLRVRGAPAIGVTAAYGVVIGTQSVRHQSRTEFETRLQQVVSYLASSRPTAVNLFWALDRMQSVVGENQSLETSQLHDRLFQEAMAIENEDRQMCRAIGLHGCQLLRDEMSILTHCNAGGLATAGDGTALSVIFHAVENGMKLHVFADETRPLLQGARLTAWELCQREVPVTVICDNMAAQVMKEGRVNAVIVGADRIAANGDTANKIGTYGVAILARYHSIPFYVAAPSSTFDLSLPDGNAIPIEQRPPDEISSSFGRLTVPSDAEIYNPAFDVTPASLITAIITEYGLILNPDLSSVRQHFARAVERDDF